MNITEVIVFLLISLNIFTIARNNKYLFLYHKLLLTLELMKRIKQTEKSRSI